MALNNNLTVTGTTTLRGNLDFARLDEFQGYGNKITTNRNGLTVVGQSTLNGLTVIGFSTLSGNTTIQ